MHTTFFTFFPTNVSLGYFVRPGQPIWLLIFAFIVGLAVFWLVTETAR